MSVREYPRLDERVSRRTLENGLEVIVVHKPRHAKQYAFFATRYGGMDLRFQLGVQPLAPQIGRAHV